MLGVKLCPLYSIRQAFIDLCKQVLTLEAKANLGQMLSYYVILIVGFSKQEIKFLIQ